MEKNPFEILGITPELVKKLDNEQLYKLVQSNYRLLQKIFHPDVASPKSSSKANSMSVELNKAFEQLNIKKDGESFKTFRKSYEQRLKRGFRRQIEDQREQVQTLSNTLSSLSTHSFRFLLHYLEDWKSRNGSASSSGASVFHLKNLTLGIFDVAVGYNLRQSSWNLGKNYKEIKFDENGSMKYRFLSRSEFSQVNFIRLLGAVKADALDIISVLDKKLTKAATLEGTRSASQFAYGAGMYEVLNTIDLDVFREELMPYLSPDLAENSYLFSIHLCNGKSVLKDLPMKVSLEGKIIKISPTIPDK